MSVILRAMVGGAMLAALCAAEAGRPERHRWWPASGVAQRRPAVADVVACVDDTQHRQRRGGTTSATCARGTFLRQRLGLGPAQVRVERGTTLRMRTPTARLAAGLARREPADGNTVWEATLSAVLPRR